MKKKCSIKIVVKKCGESCKRFPERCFNKCHVKKCGDSHCNCCKVHCVRRKPDCVKWCLKEKMLHCYLISIPPKYRTKCWDFFTHTFINKCLRKCVAGKHVRHFSHHWTEK